MFGGAGARKSPRPSFSVEEIQESLPHLEIIRVLGFGGMGAMVFLARHRGLGREIAVKILPGDLGGSSALRQRFLRESRTLAKFSHPNIVQVFGSGETSQNHLYIEMAYASGGTFEDYLVLKKPTQDQVIELVLQVCRALESLHEKGILHRDIKPGNLFIGSDGKALLGDFGLAKLKADSVVPATLTQAGQTLGTFGYMAPEQVRGEEATQQSDIYSLGVVAYEMLTGVLPHGAFEKPSLRDPSLKQYDRAIMKAISSDPSRRFISARTFREALEGGVIETGETLSPGGRGVKANLLGIAGMAGVLALVALVVLLILWPEERGQTTAATPYDEYEVLVIKKSVLRRFTDEAIAGHAKKIRSEVLARLAALGPDINLSAAQRDMLFYLFAAESVPLESVHTAFGIKVGDRKPVPLTNIKTFGGNASGRLRDYLDLTPEQSAIFTRYRLNEARWGDPR